MSCILTRHADFRCMNRLYGAFMGSSRTVKTLTVLLAAMTVGVFVLMLMETEPYQPPVSLSAMAVGSPVSALISDTAVPVRGAKWRSIVIHSTGAEGAQVASQCHFILSRADDGKIELQSTSLWRSQQAGEQTGRLGEDFNSGSIGVCLVGDFSASSPGSQQFNQLMELVKSLQKHFHIGFDRVYLLSDIDPLSRSPGDAFPARAFEQHLIR